MRTAGIVAEHAAHAAAAGRRSLRAEEKSIGLEGRIEHVPDDAGLCADPFFLRIDLQDPVEMPRHVDDDAVAHHLAGDGRPAGARNQVRTLPRGQRDQILDVLHRFRIRDAFRNLPVGARIGRISDLVQAVGEYLHPWNH